MVLRIIIELAALFALFWTIRVRKVFPAVITLGMIAGIILFLFPVYDIPFSGIYIYMFFIAMLLIYTMTQKSMNMISKILLGFIAASIFAYWLWVSNHWHGNTLFFPVITLVSGAGALVSKAKLKNELGIIVILMADALAILIEYFFK